MLANYTVSPDEVSDAQKSHDEITIPTDNSAMLSLQPPSALMEQIEQRARTLSSAIPDDFGEADDLNRNISMTSDLLDLSGLDGLKARTSLKEDDQITSMLVENDDNEKSSESS